MRATDISTVHPSLDGMLTTYDATGELDTNTMEVVIITVDQETERLAVGTVEGAALFDTNTGETEQLQLERR
jgi:hypothetical protein